MIVKAVREVETAEPAGRAAADRRVAAGGESSAKGSLPRRPSRRVDARHDSFEETCTSLYTH